MDWPKVSRYCFLWENRIDKYMYVSLVILSSPKAKIFRVVPLRDNQQMRRVKSFIFFGGGGLNHVECMFSLNARTRQASSQIHKFI